MSADVTAAHRAASSETVNAFIRMMERDTYDPLRALVAQAIADAEVRGAREHAAGLRCDHGLPRSSECPECRAFVEHVRDNPPTARAPKRRHPPEAKREPAVQHVITVTRYQKGKTPIRPTRPVYGSSGRCSACDWKGRSNYAPSLGGRRELRDQHLTDTGHPASF